MSKPSYLLAIDQGTSSTKALVFDAAGNAIAKGSEPLHTHYLNNGFVEQDAEAIYQNVLTAIRLCLQQLAANGAAATHITGIGISNQRETFVVWDAQGKPLCNAVVWQCKRSVDICTQLKQQGLEALVNEKTGLVIDPYFSATKLIWLYRNNAAVRQAIQKGEAFFGTVDTWLLYRFTNRQAYRTDHTNASRTLLFNLHTLQWDQQLIDAFGLTGIQLPQVQPSSSFFGNTNINGLLPQDVPVAAMAGDSHAAAFGEGCYRPGIAKATLGTGCSIMMNIGNKPVHSKHGMVSTICWSTEKTTAYALEGVIVTCGATIEWLKQELQLFNHSSQTATMANSVPDNGGVYLVPAFSGLGSPHWQMDRKAAITGLSFGSTKNHLVRAALESIPYQIMDVILAMETDMQAPLTQLMVDGGITANTFVTHLLCTLLNKTVTNIGITDVSALGAAMLAGLHTGLYPNMEALAGLNLGSKEFTPGNHALALEWYKGWQKAIALH